MADVTSAFNAFNLLGRLIVTKAQLYHHRMRQLVVFQSSKRRLEGASYKSQVKEVQESTDAPLTCIKQAMKTSS